MNIEAKSISEINRRATEILFERMGVVGTLRFLNQFSTGQGDYTKEREEWLGCLTLDEAISRIKAAKKEYGIVGASSEKVEPPRDDDVWAGHWIFNTNETYAPGAYQRMFDKAVIAIYGYESGGAILEGSTAGQKVLAYVNRQGLRALGEIVDPTVQPGNGIFLDENGDQQPDEYHVSVSWQVVLPAESALSNAQASDMGYSLPVRHVFARLHRGRLASKLEEEIRKRHSGS